MSELTPENPQASLSERLRRLAPIGVPQDDRSRMRMVVDSLVLHLHPTHVIAMTRKLMAHNEREAFGMEDRPESVSMLNLAEAYPEIFRYTRVGQMIGYIPPISAELGQAVADAMLESPAAAKLKCDVVALDRHGVVAVGRDPWECYEHVERLNHICEIALLSGEIDA